MKLEIHLPPLEESVYVFFANLLGYLPIKDATIVTAPKETPEETSLSFFLPFSLNLWKLALPYAVAYIVMKVVDFALSCLFLYALFPLKLRLLRLLSARNDE